MSVRERRDKEAEMLEQLSDIFNKIVEKNEAADREARNNLMNEVVWHVKRIKHFADKGNMEQAEAHVADAFRSLGQVCIALAKFPR